MNRLLYFIPVLFMTLGAGVPENNTKNVSRIQTGNSSYSYLALGDSYTIGESVSQNESFPYQLRSSLGKEGLKISKIQVIARTGWTTSDLLTAISTTNVKEKFDLVTLLIGVNNQYRGYPEDTYRKEFIELLRTAIDAANGRKDRVFVVSIPDWGVTPFAVGQERNSISKKIDEFNAINRSESLKAGVNYTDITIASRKALSDRTLIANDGLHPSAKMYSSWVQSLDAKIRLMLK